ncbi:hypothetical protein [Alkalihalobacillus sp. BA299]|uniref:hypothetical protein n=1 Tax=Alkalihalobacillus sp. BA299 TaxID=2815938 RepID=UPI001ADC0C4A|nr:hypothetical protein [Alkalihalobacillus sp. BA299]
MKAEKYDKLRKPFDELTESDYNKMIFGAASLLVDSCLQDKKIEELKQEIEELKLLARKSVTKEDRMVLKGLGVSISEITDKLPDKLTVLKGLKY